MDSDLRHRRQEPQQKPKSCCKATKRTARRLKPRKSPASKAQGKHTLSLATCQKSTLAKTLVDLSPHNSVHPLLGSVSYLIPFLPQILSLDPLGFKVNKNLQRVHLFSCFSLCILFFFFNLMYRSLMSIGIEVTGD